MATKDRNIYLGLTATQLKERSSLPSAANIAVNASSISCKNLDTGAIPGVLGLSSYDLLALCKHANVNKWSQFKPGTLIIDGSQEFIHSRPDPQDPGEFCAYNHNAPTPTINEGGGPGGSKSYDYEGIALLVRVQMQMGEVNWPAISADITHLYCFLSYGGSEHFTLEYEITSTGLQYVGAEIDFNITANRSYSCAFWFGKPANKKIAKFPGFPSFTINAVYAVPADVEVTSIGTIANGLEYDRMNVSFNFTNTGGAGSATIYWQLYNSSNVKIDEGSQSVSFAAGSGSRALSGLTYPSAGTGYTLRIKEADDSSWEVSNSFNVTP